VKHRSRLERAEQLGIAAASLAAGEPLRQVATGLGVARSTLRGWRAAEPLDGMPAEVAACLSTPGGARWLHRLVVAMHLVVTLRAGAGVRLVCELLTLSGLSAVVGASYGSQYAVNVQVQEAVVGQAQELRAALAVDMPPREVAVCEDETFHPEICLVAIEPVSNFILWEQDAADRTAATWTQALERALTGLPVTVVQGTSDEAKALRRHIEKDRGAQHVSDLFQPLLRLVWVGHQSAPVPTVTKRAVVAPQASWARSRASAAQCGQRVDEWGQAGGNSWHSSR